MTKEPNERVLRAAARLFRQKGFEGTTVRDIAAEAGMLLGSLHYRYATKDEVLLALMEHAVSSIIEEVRATVSATKDPIERLKLGLRAHLRLLLSGGDSVYVLLFEWRSLTGKPRAEIIKQRDRYEAYWDGLIADAVKTGKGRKVDVKLVRLFGFGAINWVATWYREGGKYSPEELADAYFDFLARGLLK